MGSDLIETDELFRQDIEAMDAVLRRVENSPSWSIMSTPNLT